MTNKSFRMVRSVTPPPKACAILKALRLPFDFRASRILLWRSLSSSTVVGVADVVEARKESDVSSGEVSHFGSLILAFRHPRRCAVCHARSSRSTCEDNRCARCQDCEGLTHG